ncbi:unnamed protein product [Caenorhabditis auriculariae]|uniref:Uncharacterized protein n=1 Tax=Caenorhabditis auriculariae TaxID=2777116 RepID=A0A8S1H692_9PELO|nr:unnamed protein product [Caenorhabditis auriculariae]
MTITQKTFGSRVLLCPDITSDRNACHELAGPRVLDVSPKKMTFPLDVGASRFFIVLYHDKSVEFGPASFEIHSIDIRNPEDGPLCA